VPLVALCASVVLGATPEPVKFISAKPAYDAITLTGDEKKVLLLAFDESAGTGTGYDTVYADANFNNVIEATEKVAVQGDATASYVTYEPLNFDFGYNDAAQGLDKPLVLTLSRAPQPTGGGNGFSASLSARLKQDDVAWEYTFRRNMQLFMDRKDVLPHSTRPLTTLVTTRPGGAGLGIAVRLAAGDFSISCYSPQGSPQVRLVVKNEAGETVSDATMPLDRLGFG
jgi:hypothetical protein